MLSHVGLSAARPDAPSRLSPSPVITTDELFSDAYDIIETGDEGIVEVNCQTITIKEGDVDIGALPPLPSPPSLSFAAQLALVCSSAQPRAEQPSGGATELAGRPGTVY